MADTTTPDAAAAALAALSPQALRHLASDLRRTCKHLGDAANRLLDGESDVVCRATLADGSDVEIALGIHQLIPIIEDRRVRLINLADRLSRIARDAERGGSDGMGVAISGTEG